MAKPIGIEMKYYASSLGNQMCNHWAPKTYLRNGTLEACGVQIKFDSRIFLIHSNQAIFKFIGHKLFLNSSSMVYFGHGDGEALWH